MAWDLLLRFGESDGDKEPILELAGLQRLCATLSLGFSPADVASVAASSSASSTMTVAEFADLFDVPIGDRTSGTLAGTSSQPGETEVKPKTWDCTSCGCNNPAFEIMCEQCGFGWNGQREVISNY